VILVQCDECGTTVSAIWDFRSMTWKVVLAKWWDVQRPGQVGLHACSIDCRDKMDARLLNSEGSEQVAKRRKSFRLLIGGGDGAT